MTNSSPPPPYIILKIGHKMYYDIYDNNMDNIDNDDEQDDEDKFFYWIDGKMMPMEL